MSTSVLVISDDSLNASGFGTVIRNVFGKMHRKHKDIKITAISLFADPSSKARVVDTVKPIIGDTYGSQTVLCLKETNNYDIIFLLGDWWYWSSTLLNNEWKKANNITQQIWYYVPLDGVILDKHQKEAYRTADKLIAMTPFGLSSLNGCSYNPVVYIPHGFDDKTFYYRPRKKRNKFTIGIVSRNSSRKNIWAILTAVKNILKYDKYNIEVFIHTPVNDTAGGDLKQYIKAMDMEHFIEFTDGQKIGWPHIEGYKDEDMYHEVYSQIDCLVSAGREGFGLPYLEAAACGIPLILPTYSGHYSMDYSNTDYYLVDTFKPDPSGVLDMVVDVTRLESSIKHMVDNSKIENPLDKYKDLSWDNISELFYNLITTEFKKTIEEPDNYEIENSKFIEKYGYTEEVEIEESILFVMPASNGDVLLSTATISSLHKKYPHHKITFATQRKFFSILEGNPDIHDIVEFNPILHCNYGLLHRKYDMVFTPYFDTQVAANWVHGGNGRSLAEVYANNCGVELGEYWLRESYYENTPDCKYITVHTGSGKGEQYSRNYEKWEEFVTLLKSHKPNLKIILIGTTSDMPISGTDDFRGKLDVQQLYYVLARASCHVGIDSFPMHVAAILGVPSVIIWGNTYPKATGPEPKMAHYQTNIEPLVRSKICPRACHKVNCEHCKDALNSIKESSIVREVLNYV